MSGIDQILKDESFEAAENATGQSGSNPFTTESVTNSLQTQINNFTPDNHLDTGSVTWSNVGLTYDISALTYVIQHTPYTAIASQVTLDPAPVGIGDSRIDSIYVDDQGLTGVITGVEAPAPVATPVDNATQLLLTTVTLVVGQTTPVLVVEDVYLDNQPAPAEWTGTTNGTVIFNSIAQPVLPNTVNIETTAALANNKWIKFTPAVDYTIAGGVLTLKLWAKQDMSGNSGRITVGFYNNGLLKGNTIILGGSGNTYGFDGSVIGVYQLVAITLSSMGLNVGIGDVDELRFSRSGGSSAVNFYMANVAIQELVTTPTTPLFDGTTIFANTTGVADVYEAALTPAIAGPYVDGMMFNIWFSLTNTGASTLDINGIGAHPILKNGGDPVVAGDLLTTQAYSLIYRQNRFLLLGHVGSGSSGLTSVTNAAMLALTPAAGSQVYNTTWKAVYTYDGDVWLTPNLIKCINGNPVLVMVEGNPVLQDAGVATDVEFTTLSQDSGIVGIVKDVYGGPGSPGDFVTVAIAGEHNVLFTGAGAVAIQDSIFASGTTGHAFASVGFSVGQLGISRGAKAGGSPGLVLCWITPTERF